MSIFILFLSCCFLFAAPAWSTSEPSNNTLTSIRMPINIDLNEIQTKLNDDLPVGIARIGEDYAFCILPQWFDIATVDEDFVETYQCPPQAETPASDQCVRRGSVDRGKIGIEGADSTLRVSLPIDLRLPPDSCDDEQQEPIAATFLVDITPILKPDWQLDLAIASDFQWNNKPDLKLESLVDTPFWVLIAPFAETAADPILGGATATIDKLLINPLIKAPLGQILDKTQINTVISKTVGSLIWANVEGFIEREMTSLGDGIVATTQATYQGINPANALQQPVPIYNDPEAYFTFVPQHVGFSGLNIKANELAIFLDVKGETDLHIGLQPEPHGASTVLVEPVTIAQEPDIAIILPVTITDKALLQLIATHMPDGYHSDPTQADTLAVDVTTIAFAEDLVSLQIELDYKKESGFIGFLNYFDWIDVKGSIRTSFNPAIANNEVTFSELSLESESNNRLFDELIGIANIGFISRFIASFMTLDLNEKIDPALVQANRSFDSLTLAEILGKQSSAPSGLEKLTALKAIKMTANVRSLVLKDLIARDGWLAVTVQLAGRAAITSDAVK